MQKVTINERVSLGNECLGKSTFSSVYKGIRIDDKGNKVPVAIKIMDTKNTTKKMMEYINQELEIMRIIKSNPHPNIVHCYEIVRKRSKIYIVMEFCENGDLGKYINKPINETYVQFYFAQIAEGIKYLFSHNIVHRDIKPKNILLTGDRKVLKIADFGLAKSVDEGIYSTMCGSPLYMSPEVMYGKEYNSQTDLWSIGMILFEMLYGFHPFQDCKNVSELLNSVKTTDISIPPEDHHNKNKNVSDEAISLLKMLLQKNVNRRIGWDDFFTHPWINKWEYVFESNILQNKENNMKLAVSLKGMTPCTQLEDNSIDILENNEELSEQLLNSLSDESDDNDECMFVMDDVCVKRSSGEYEHIKTC